MNESRWRGRVKVTSRQSIDGREDEETRIQAIKQDNLASSCNFFGRGKCKYVITWYICGVQGNTPYDF